MIGLKSPCFSAPTTFSIRVVRPRFHSVGTIDPLIPAGPDVLCYVSGADGEVGG